MTDQWPLSRPLRIDDDCIVGPAPPGRRAAASAPLIVLVGLTGAGKSTLARALVEAGRAHMLPDRRQLTDAVILGDEASSLDRAGRFAATARFRAAAPGGMGEILAALSVAPTVKTPLLFDGLRGATELSLFAPLAPSAVFLALAVSDEVRAIRIASRGDRFDGAASGSAERARAIVADEAAHYNLDEALASLAVHAAGRYHVLDAEHQSADAVAAEATALIAAMMS